MTPTYSCISGRRDITGGVTSRSNEASASLGLLSLAELFSQRELFKLSNPLTRMENFPKRKKGRNFTIGRIPIYFKVARR